MHSADVRLLDLEKARVEIQAARDMDTETKSRLLKIVENDIRNRKRELRSELQRGGLVSSHGFQGTFR
jgi:hypothetical protein